MGKDDKNNPEKPSEYGLGDWVKGEVDSVKQGLTDKYKESMDEALGDLPENASGLKKTGRLFSWAGKKLGQKTKKVAVDLKEQYTPASDELRRMDGIETLIGSQIIGKPGRTRVRECRTLLDTLMTYDLPTNVNMGDDTLTIELNVYNTVLTDVAGYAFTEMEQVQGFYRSQKLREHPEIAQVVVRELAAAEKRIDDNRKYTTLVKQVEQWDTSQTVRDTLLKDLQKHKFTTTEEMMHHYIHSSAGDVSRETVSEIFETIQKYDADNALR